MSQYLILIYADEAQLANDGDVAWKELSTAHAEFMEQTGAALLGGNALQGSATATSIRSSSTGDATVTDGPFAETKEALGGYYLIEAADLDEALEIAKRCPRPHGGVEVRPVMVFN